MTESDVPNDIEVWIALPSASENRQHGGFGDTSEVEQQSKVVDKVVDAVRTSSAEFIDSWTKAVHAVEALFESEAGTASTSPSKFELESVTAKLSLTATGKVVFVGELGGEISFEAVFKRRPRTNDPAAMNKTQHDPSNE